MNNLYTLVTFVLIMLLPQVALSNDETTTEKAAETTEQTAEQKTDDNGEAEAAKSIVVEPSHTNEEVAAVGV